MFNVQNIYLETISSVKCPRFKWVKLRYYLGILFGISEMLQSVANYICENLKIRISNQLEKSYSEQNAIF